MRLLILGASGGCGRWLTRLAATRGHSVTAVVRQGSSLGGISGVSVRTGDVTEQRFLEGVIGGHDAVLSCLGIRRAGKAPWARMLSPADFTERVARELVPAMQHAGVRRVVAISAGGVADSLAQLAWPVRMTLGSGAVAAQYRDLGEMEAVLASSGLDFLIVRPVTLVNGEPRGTARAVSRYGIFSHIRRSEVAAWMLDAVEQPGPFRERHVMIAW